MLSHSAAVHIPLALAVLFPLLHLALLLAIKTGWLPHRVWLLACGASVIQVVNCGLAYQTGMRDRVLAAAPAELLSHHQDYGQSFFWVWLVIAVILPLAFVMKNRPVSRSLHILLLILLASQFLGAFELGHIGGQIAFGK